jgi:Phage integrase, N-terminal SAM-like domain
LRDTLDQARRGTLPGAVRTGVIFADAAAERLRCVAEDRDVKPSTLIEYRSVVSSRLLPEFADPPVEEITPDRIEAWRASLGVVRSPTGRATKR